MNMFCSAVVIVCLSVFCVVDSELYNVTVQAPAGSFIGYRENINTGSANVELDKFLGIPFAEPPVRFRKPVPKAHLQNPLVVQNFSSGCIQLDVFMSGDPISEDCLYLNVYAPVRTNSSERLAVMVWIYGGAFLFGSATIYKADLLATVGEVVVVTFNYRLSALGFLNVPNTDIDANCGLWDQHLAIKWVHDNIGSFGGDPERVTIFGESAGAASAIYQGFYSGNKGLFQRIIAESGTSAVAWAYTENAIDEARSFASLVNCTSESNQAMVDCLTMLSLDVYMQKITELAFAGLPVPFIPSRDSEFVTVSPYDLLNLSANLGDDAKATFASVDLLTGINTAEGGLLLGPATGYSGDINTFLPSKSDFDKKYAQTCVNITFGKRAPYIPVELIKAEYTQWDDPQNPVAIRNQIVDMYTDSLYMAPMARTLNFHAEESSMNTFMYHFTTVPSSHVFPAPSWLDEALHGDEVLYVFGEVADYHKMGYMGQFEAWEKEYARNIMKLWTNFAKTGNMNEPYDLGLNWQKYTKENHEYLEIVRNLTDSVMKRRLNGKRVNLWNNILPDIAQIERSRDQCNDDRSSRAHTFASAYLSAVHVCLFIFLLFLV